MKATANVLCYRSKVLSNGEHPLMLRVCMSGKKEVCKPWHLCKNLSIGTLRRTNLSVIVLIVSGY